MSLKDKKTRSQPVKEQETMESEINTFITNAVNIRSDFFEKLKDVQRALENTFKVFDPSWTPKKMYAHDLLAIKEKLLTWTTTPWFFISDDWSPAKMNRLVTKYVTSVLRKAWYRSIFIWDEWLFDSMYTDWTAFITVWIDSEKKKLQLWHPSISRVYFDKFATNIRRDWSETQAKQCLIILEMSRDQAVAEYPEIDKMDIENGRLPWATMDSDGDESNYVNWSQQSLVEWDIIQVWLWYDILDWSIFKTAAWPKATIIPERTAEEKEYPHFNWAKNSKDRVDVLPITDFKTYSLRRGIYNPWVMQLMFTLNRIREILDNKRINYTINNIDDIKIVNIFKGKVDSFFNDYMDAQEDQANGEKWIVVNEYDETEPRWVWRVESLRSDPLTNDLIELYQRLDQIIRRDWINLDDVFTNPNKTKWAVVLEAEAQVEVIEKFINRNTPSFTFIVERAIQFVRETVDSDDETIVESKIILGWEQVDITAWIVADWLRDETKDRYTEVNTKSWVNRNKALQISSIESAMTWLRPDSKAWNNLVIEKARVQWFDVSDSDLSWEAEATLTPASNWS